MTEVRDPASMIEAAQKAASDGDYAAAERLLGEAAAIQEAGLGSSHPDLASTLNNLAFVCERLNKFEEAERGYRRAHAIAVASLSPGHPFIKTSLTNLLEFCATRGIPVWTPPSSRVPEPPDDEVEPDDGQEPVAVRRRLPLAIAAPALGVAAIVVVIFFARQGQGTTDTPRPVVQVQQASAPDSPPAVTTTTPAPRLESRPPATRVPRPATNEPVTVLNAPVTVLNAQLCSALEKRGSPDWQCAPAGGEVPPGTYTFYTRLLTNAGTMVEHRWYRDSRVHQVMRLRVPASPGNGYRTFSSNTVSPERAGDWKVELRAADGSLLQEQRFVVR